MFEQPTSSDSSAPQTPNLRPANMDDFKEDPASSVGLSVIGLLQLGLAKQKIANPKLQALALTIISSSMLNIDLQNRIQAAIESGANAFSAVMNIMNDFINNLAEQLSSEQPNMATTNQDMILLGNQQGAVALMTNSQQMDSTIAVPIIRPQDDEKVAEVPLTLQELSVKYSGTMGYMDRDDGAQWTPSRPSHVSRITGDVQINVNTEIDQQWEDYDSVFMDNPTLLTQILSLLNLLTTRAWQRSSLTSLLALLYELKRQLDEPGQTFEMSQMWPDKQRQEVIDDSMGYWFYANNELIELLVEIEERPVSVDDWANIIEFETDEDMLRYMTAIFNFHDKLQAYLSRPMFTMGAWTFPHGGGSYEVEDINAWTRFTSGINKETEEPVVYWLVYIDVAKQTVFGYNPKNKEIKELRMGKGERSSRQTAVQPQFEFPEPSEEFDEGDNIRLSGSNDDRTYEIVELYANRTAQVTKDGNEYIVVLFYFELSGDRV